MSLLLSNKRKRRIITDPYASSVVLYLKGDGTNGSTTIIDSSPLAKTMSVFGNAQISTAQSKYGGSSILFNGNGDYITTSALNLTSVDFTMETWIYVLTHKLGVILTSYTNPNQVNTFVSFTHSDQSLVAYNGNASSVATSAVSLNTWLHYAVTYTHATTSIKLYLNGTLAGTVSGGITNQNSTLWIGGAPSDNNLPTWWLNSYLDSLRVTRGVVRYTGNFNPNTDTYLAY